MTGPLVGVKELPVEQCSLQYNALPVVKKKTHYSQANIELLRQAMQGVVQRGVEERRGLHSGDVDLYNCGKYLLRKFIRSYFYVPQNSFDLITMRILSRIHRHIDEVKRRRCTVTYDDLRELILEEFTQRARHEERAGEEADSVD